MLLCSQEVTIIKQLTIAQHYSD